GHIRYAEDEGPLDTRAYLLALGEDLAANTVANYADKDTDPETWDLDALETAVSEIFGFDPAERETVDFGGKTADEMTDLVWDLARQKYEKKEALLQDPSILHRVEREIMLQIVDSQWKDHLRDLDHLKEGIGLRGYGQRDPLVEYKKESFGLFSAMRERVEEEIVRYLWRLMPMMGDGTEGTAVPAPRRPAPRPPSPMKLSSAPSQPPSSPFGAVGRAGPPAPPPRGHPARRPRPCPP